ncbi:hypothetical protein BDN72DRAFT_956011 [Pluteus cervinus]|uniref:Uncharacterized protein n=1 Tax=Pluteus cervinus TaxID=181527 RepID=A0ACD3BAZ8_9AGAR|nr:hypothetical protein BDN72DRAFT_956011 [Pluteus cervinus]
MKPDTSFIKNLTKRFSKRTTRLPHYWPSPLHNKCSNDLCQYPNPPQVNEGSYRCNGHAKNAFFCGGTYHVDLHRARESDLYWRSLFSDESQYHDQLTKLKQRKEDAEMERQRTRRQYLIDEEGRKKASAEAAKYYDELRAKKRREREEGKQPRWKVARRQAAAIAADQVTSRDVTDFFMDMEAQNVQTTLDSRGFEAVPDLPTSPVPRYEVLTTQCQSVRPAWASRPLPRAINKRPQLTIVI